LHSIACAEGCNLAGTVTQLFCENKLPNSPVFIVKKAKIWFLLLKVQNCTLLLSLTRLAA
jgi:hypothetical protein